MGDVLGLNRAPPGQPVESVIQTLEEALDRARRGETVAVIIGEVRPDGRTATSLDWSEGIAAEGILAVAAALDHNAKRRLLG